MRPRPARGFTLIELGAVLAVTAILAAAIVPDFIEASRNRMAQKAASDVAVIHDAARWFYAQSYGADTEDLRGRWPGQTTAGSCTNGTTPNFGLIEMRSLHYLPKLPANPWGLTYEARVVNNPQNAAGVPATINGGQRWGCSFEVATDLPEEITTAFIAFLPLGRCNTGAATDSCMPPTSASAPTGFVRCCATVPPPGAGWCPPGTRPRLNPAAPGNLQLQCL